MGKKIARILIVDDDPLVRKAHSHELKEAGFHVQAAESGELALQLFEADPFEIVYTDLVMPGMNGVDVCKAIKKIRPETEVILISAKPVEILKFQNEFRDAGGRDEILRKPLSEEELTRVTQSILREKYQN